MIKVKCTVSRETWFTEGKIYNVFTCTDEDLIDQSFIFDDSDQAYWALEPSYHDEDIMYVMNNEFLVVG